MRSIHVVFAFVMALGAHAYASDMDDAVRAIHALHQAMPSQTRLEDADETARQITKSLLRTDHRKRATAAEAQAMVDAHLYAELFYAFNTTGGNRIRDHRLIYDFIVNLASPDYAQDVQKQHLTILTILSLAAQEYFWNPQSNVDDLQKHVRRELRYGLYKAAANPLYVADRIYLEGPVLQALISSWVNDSLIHKLRSLRAHIEAPSSPLMVVLLAPLGAMQTDKVILRPNLTGLRHANEFGIPAHPPIELIAFPSAGDGLCGFHSCFIPNDGPVSGIYDNARAKVIHNLASHFDDPDFDKFYFDISPYSHDQIISDSDLESLSPQGKAEYKAFYARNAAAKARAKEAFEKEHLRSLFRKPESLQAQMGEEYDKFIDALTALGFEREAVKTMDFNDIKKAIVLKARSRPELITFENLKSKNGKYKTPGELSARMKKSFILLGVDTYPKARERFAAIKDSLEKYLHKSPDELNEMRWREIQILLIDELLPEEDMRALLRRTYKDGDKINIYDPTQEKLSLEEKAKAKGIFDAELQAVATLLSVDAAQIKGLTWAELCRDLFVNLKATQGAEVQAFFTKIEHILGVGSTLSGTLDLINFNTTSILTSGTPKPADAQTEALRQFNETMTAVAGYLGVAPEYLQGLTWGQIERRIQNKALEVFRDVIMHHLPRAAICIAGDEPAAINADGTPKMPSTFVKESLINVGCTEADRIFIDQADLNSDDEKLAAIEAGRIAIDNEYAGHIKNYTYKHVWPLIKHAQKGKIISHIQREATTGEEGLRQNSGWMASSATYTRLWALSHNENVFVWSDPMAAYGGYPFLSYYSQAYGEEKQEAALVPDETAMKEALGYPPVERIRKLSDVVWTSPRAKRVYLTKSSAHYDKYIEVNDWAALARQKRHEQWRSLPPNDPTKYAIYPAPKGSSLTGGGASTGAGVISTGK